MVQDARRRWLLLAVVGAGLLLITLDNSILYAALPTLVDDLGASSSQSLWIINAYPVVMAGLLLGSGTLGDRIGHRRMFLIGLVVFGVASLAAAFSPTADTLIAARAFLAVGAAAMMPATLALIRVTFHDERERNVAIAVWGSLALVGGALGPIIGGLLLNSFWWGSVFLVNVPVVVAALIATLVLAPPNDADPTKRWDLVSSLLALVALVGLVIAIKETAKPDPAPAPIAIALLAAVVGGWAFARRQHRLPYPLLDFAIFRNRAFLAGVLSAGFSLFALAGIQLITTQRFQLVEGYTPLGAGLLVAAVALGALPLAMVGGAILHKVGLLPLIAGGLALGTVGSALVLLNFDSSTGLLITGLLVTGAGLGAAMSVASSAIMGNVPASRAGMASSVEEVSYEFGSLIAVALLGSLLTGVYAATVDLPAGVPDSARDSLDKALTLAGNDNPSLVTAASTAFDGAYFTVMVVVTAVMAVGTIVTGLLLRRHGPGSALSAPVHH
ncbi:Antiseptic resistance protein [Streptomyces sp. ADI96-02]|uniref:MFS transporter n=1 Tax=Streptomyces sp. ADI96-02 TaxID=1522760 RepID=UPI000F552580|nr:MFS transporter [Streptomyces sp. ADI96-02]RPK65654.1 Antiseptic resistance protein [Streptomyces sp. ADI96-02]